MAEADRVTIDIPEFATMSDDDVAAHPLMRVLDGRCSPLTPAAIKPMRHRGSAGGTTIPLQRMGSSSHLDHSGFPIASVGYITVITVMGRPGLAKNRGLVWCLKYRGRRIGRVR